MNDIQKELILLPTYFKKIAFGIIIVSFLFYFFSDRETISSVSKFGLLPSLSLLAITKDKIEDERTIRIRLKAFTLAFLYGVLIVIVKDLFFDESNPFKSSRFLLIQMLLAFFSIKYALKKYKY